MRRLPSLVLATVATFVLAGCTSSNDPGDPSASGVGSLPGVRISGDFGRAPTISVPKPLEIDDSASRVLTRGTGPTIQPDQLFILELTLVDGRTGHTAISTYDEGKTAMAVKESDAGLFPVLLDALSGQRQGSRIVVTATADDAYGDAGAPQYGISPGDPIVMVADVLAVPPKTVLKGAAGKKVPARKGLPTVVLKDGAVSRVDFSHAREVAPKNLLVVPLVEGTGPPVRADSLVTLDYLGQLYGTKKVFADTFATSPTTIALGTNRAIKAWEKGLVGVPRGSRVLLIAPPRLAFKATGSPPSIPGSATLAYVIDVLGVS